MRGTSRGLAAAAAMAMAALSITSTAAVRAPSKQPLRVREERSGLFDVTGQSGFSALNGRARGAGMAAVRVARKKRNQQRHRKACRGRP